MKERWWKAAERPLVSAFITLNLVTVGFMNLPGRVIDGLDAKLMRLLTRPLQARARLASFRIRQYANITGLDPHWEMFSEAKGDDWRYRIEGVCPSGNFKLPLAGQSVRSFWQEYFFDFKEGKLRCNTALYAPGRKAYAEYLCRNFTCPSGEPLQRVQIDIDTQRILDPREARAQGRHLAPEIKSERIEDVGCP